MVKRLVIKGVTNIILFLFLVFVVSISGYFYMQTRTNIDSLYYGLDFIRDFIRGDIYKSLEVSISNLDELIFFQTTIFLISGISLVLLVWHLFNLFLIQKKGALEDPLTEINNRRAILIGISKEIQRSRRFDHPLSIAMMDIDYFKKFNDVNGHVAGDRVLKRVARILKKSIRDTDYIGRIGGEEFLLIFPETSINNASKVCENLRKIIEKSIFAGQENMPNKKITVSIGVSGLKDKRTKDKWALIAEADKRLYVAKEKGRNQVKS